NGGPGLSAVGGNPMADRILSSPVAPRERLVHHRHLRGPRSIRLGKPAPGDERDAECAEVAWGHRPKVSLRQGGTLGGGPSLDHELEAEGCMPPPERKAQGR